MNADPNPQVGTPAPLVAFSTTGVRKALADEYDKEIKTTEENIKFYKKFRTIRWWSRACRLLAIFLLGFGIIAPLFNSIYIDGYRIELFLNEISQSKITPENPSIKSQNPFVLAVNPALETLRGWAGRANWIALSYIALVASAFMLALDRFTLGTTMHASYVAAYLNLKDLQRLMEIEKNRFMNVARDDNAAFTVLSSEYAKIIEFERARALIVKNETASWAANVQSALSELDTRIGAALAGVKSQITDARVVQEKANLAAATGAVRIKITYPQDFAERVTVGVNDQISDYLNAPSVVGFSGIVPGHHIVTAKAFKGTSVWREMDDVVKITAGETVEVQFAFV